MSSLSNAQIIRPYSILPNKLPFLTRGYANRRNGILLGLRYANVSLAHSGVESS